MALKSLDVSTTGAEARIELVAQYAEMRRKAGQDAERLQAANEWALAHGLRYVGNYRRDDRGIITRSKPVDYAALAAFLREERTAAEIFAFTGQSPDARKMSNARQRLEAHGFRLCSRGEVGQRVFWVEGGCLEHEGRESARKERA